MKYEPREYQDLITAFQTNNHRSNIWASMGAGKTVSTLTSIDLLHLSGFTSHPFLVVAPLRVAQSTWPTEGEKWDHLSTQTVSSIVGTPEQRLRALNVDASVYTINYENLPWLIEYYGKRWPFRGVVSDESTKLKGFRLRGMAPGSPIKHLARVARLMDFWWNLTGTPAPNGYLDLWGQQWFIDHGKTLGLSYTAYRSRYFHPEHADRHAKWVPFEMSEELIQDQLLPSTLRVDVKDYMDIDDPLVNVIEVDLPKKAMKHYREMEREMFTQIAGMHDIEAMIEASKSMKCRQISNGAVYDADKVAHKIHDAKIDALRDVVEEAAGMPILVSYEFKTDVERILKAFPKAEVLGKNPKQIEKWNDGKIPMLLAHPASAGHGLNLQYGSNILVFFGITWNLEHHDQIIERIGPLRQKQAGLDREVWIHYIVGRDTVDQLIMRALESKRDIQSVLLEAMKR